ncbi:hypothetical protein AU381_07955 [Sinorhizobium glycinis]|uniref:Uncharacterized protein n=1 Tax=Sinorhizobium glycinis TaxID=1472378 RepID=A0A178XUP2_9HYPH|nr:hypothetical protein [Sinorhizobium glycinis]OAP39030.1 hypothetical protein AU381_07955 [Sinorhizobium glycinis]
MTNHESQTRDPADTPRQRFYTLFRVMTSSALIAILAAGVSTSALELWHRIYPQDQVKVWQITGGDYERLLGTLETSNYNLERLEKIVASNPEAASLVGRLRADVIGAQSVLQSASYIEKFAYSLPSLVTVANAQEPSTKAAAERDPSPGIFLYLILGLVAFVLVVFCLMYCFTQDKTKKAFAEKTISTIIGFALGMLTGGKVR